MDTVNPKAIRLELTTNCQLRCPACPTAKGEIRRSLGNGYLRAADFGELLFRNPELKEIELSNWGEVFLNPDLEEILRLASLHNVALYIDNGANLNLLRDPLAEALVKFRCRTLACSIDGATQATYERYRVGGALEAVLGNIRRINEFKHRYRSRYPYLIWQFVRFDHNLHELDQARRLAKSLGMSFYVKAAWGDSFRIAAPASRHINAGQAVAPSLLSTRLLDDRICAQLWTQPQVNYDGRILGCCINTWGDFGRIGEDPLAKSLNSERLRRARRMLLGRADSAEGIPCTTCSRYQRMCSEKRWLTVGFLTRNRFEWWATRRAVQSPKRVWNYVERIQEKMASLFHHR